MVEFVFIKVKATDQGADGAVARVQGNEGPFHLGQLGDFPVGGALDDANHRPGPQLDVGGRLIGQARLNGFEAFSGDLDHLAVLPHRAHQFGCGLQHHRRKQVALVALFDQGVVDQLFALTGVAGQVDEFFRATVVLAFFIVHDAPSQRLVGHFLIGGAHRGVDLQAPGIGVGTVLGKHQ